jgi:hypothetical protein
MRISLRKAFLSDELNDDLSIALISSTRAISALISADSASMIEPVEIVGFVISVAWTGIIINISMAVTRDRVSFFIVILFLFRNLAVQGIPFINSQRSFHLFLKVLHTFN